MASSLSQLCAEALSREGDAVEYEGRWYRWPELRVVAEKVTALLDGSNAAVVMIARNRPSAIAAEFALVAAGRTIKMVYPFQSAQGIAASIERLEPAIVIGEEREFAPEVRAVMAARGNAGIRLSDMDATALPGFEQAGGNAPDAGGEPRIEILTSGTTGTPKQFPIPYALIAEHHVAAIRASMAGKVAATQPPMTIYAPLGNISGIFTTVAPLIVGMRAVLWDRFKIDLWLDYVKRFQPASSGIPCASLQELLDRNVPPEDLASIKAMGMGAAPLDPTLQKEFEERYGIPMLVSYGATEFGGPVTFTTLDHIAEFGFSKRGSVGRPGPGVKVRIVDPETGAELPAGSEGLMEVVSPRIGPQWLRTADIGMIDADGFVWHRGRADGAIMRGGFKILPETIERALVSHEAVSDAGVVGVADKRVGQVPGAVIVLKPGADADASALEVYLRGQLLATQIPAHWRFVETLPKNASAKIDRLALKALFDDVAQ